MPALSRTRRAESPSAIDDQSILAVAPSAVFTPFTPFTPIAKFGKFGKFGNFTVSPSSTDS